ncbi:hypothetical protein [Pandoravirus japonicus]|uniref:Uncharacterized protein n=1 Tax=Pandoravirus japonicus TaxID=2823154 RepID=A0A811BP93_9VIRU|nr:hypothetical protein [Pandoravirus japonicus]
MCGIHANRTKRNKRKENPDNDLETCANKTKTTRFVHSDSGASADPNASASATNSHSHSCSGSGRNGWFYPTISASTPIVFHLLTSSSIPAGTD